MRRTWACFVAALAIAAQGCAPTPYGGGDHKPIDSEPGAGESGTVGMGDAKGNTGSGTTSPTPSTPTPSKLPSTPPVLHETFDGSPVFSANKGALTLVPGTVGMSGRLCADSTGHGSLGADVGPAPAGTYTISAQLMRDPAAPPSSTWQLDATSYSPAPTSKGDQGPLAPKLETVTTTVVVGNAFDTTFSVMLATTANTCMIVEDILVTYVP